MYEQRPFGRRNPPQNRPPDDGKHEGRGDYRGPYGYGRPAHKTDPFAVYEFSPESPGSTESGKS